MTTSSATTTTVNNRDQHERDAFPLKQVHGGVDRHADSARADAAQHRGVAHVDVPAEKRDAPNAGTTCGQYPLRTMLGHGAPAAAGASTGPGLVSSSASPKSLPTNPIERNAIASVPASGPGPKIATKSSAQTSESTQRDDTSISFASLSGARSGGNIRAMNRAPGSMPLTKRCHVAYFFSAAAFFRAASSAAVCLSNAEPAKGVPDASFTLRTTAQYTAASSTGGIGEDQRARALPAPGVLRIGDEILVLIAVQRV